MNLHELLNNISYSEIVGSVNQKVNHISTDSRDVKENTLFVAIKGFTVDGHNFIQKAIDAGANTIVVEDNYFTNEPNVTVIRVADSRKALSTLACNFYDSPADELQLIGITGTNGKTSISYIINSLLRLNQFNRGVIGTNGILINDKEMMLSRTTPTTPEALDINAILTEMIKAKTDYCMMEVSSHSLQLHRVSDLTFSVGIFTNLTPDHLELHGTMENYFLAKAQLFYLTNECNIINIDDPYGKRLVQMLVDKPAKAQSFTYGLTQEADYYATDIQYHFNETTFTLHTPHDHFSNVTLSLPGKINLYNTLAAIAMLEQTNQNIEKLCDQLSLLSAPKGRFELIYDQSFKVLIDFAHTEDALKQLLSSVKELTSNRIILVFGVYADMSQQGQSKRYNMGKVAAQLADFSIITLDNPKHHPIDTILDEITSSVNQNNGEHTTIADRKEAIEYALEQAQPNDIVIIAGKGHEMTQVIGHEEIPFNEKEIVLNKIKAMNDS